MSRRTTYAQAWRYATVGLASNFALYAAYLLLTDWGFSSKPTMTLLYALAVVLTFVFNKRWAFGSAGARGPQFRRYCLAYLVGYGANLLGLFLLTDLLGWPHQLAQGILIFVIAVLLFLLQKFWVFRTPARTKAPVSIP